jgi:hypothetical protein
VNEYENARRVCYEGGATFIPVCEMCHRFVKADPMIVTRADDGLVDKPNATCSLCGRTKMLFEGFI